MLLVESNPRGTFLVRNSENAPGLLTTKFSSKNSIIDSIVLISGPFSLSVRDFDDQRGVHVKHYKIRYPDPNIGYYIATRRTFKTLEELIDHYSSRFLLVNELKNKINSTYDVVFF